MSQTPQQLVDELKAKTHNLLAHARPPLSKDAALRAIEGLIENAYDKCSTKEDRARLIKILSLIFHPNKAANNPFVRYFSGELVSPIQQIINKIKEKHENSFTSRPSSASAYAALLALVPSLLKKTERYGQTGHEIVKFLTVVVSYVLAFFLLSTLLSVASILLSVLVGFDASLLVSASILIGIYSSPYEPYKERFINWLTDGQYGKELDENGARDGLNNIKLIMKSFYLSITNPPAGSEGNKLLSLFVIRPLKFLGASFAVAAASAYELMKATGQAFVALFTAAYVLFQIPILALLTIPLFVMDFCSFLSRKFQEFTHGAKPQPINDINFLIGCKQSASPAEPAPVDEQNPVHFDSLFQTPESSDSELSDDDDSHYVSASSSSVSSFG